MALRLLFVVAADVVDVVVVGVVVVVVVGVVVVVLVVVPVPLGGPPFGPVHAHATPPPSASDATEAAAASELR
ncbi:MAG TPA: hypothetical protein VG410_07715 [Solirubrobacteraceae bacterium]|nr:hypothetical protein [Solirubrobacteraceae bacterium]